MQDSNMIVLLLLPLLCRCQAHTTGLGPAAAAQQAGTSYHPSIPCRLPSSIRPTVSYTSLSCTLQQQQEHCSF
jgi:hypothetical protein